MLRVEVIDFTHLFLVWIINSVAQTNFTYVEDEANYVAIVCPLSGPERKGLGLGLLY